MVQMRATDADIPNGPRPFRIAWVIVRTTMNVTRNDTRTQNACSFPVETMCRV